MFVIPFLLLWSSNSFSQIQAGEFAHNAQPYWQGAMIEFSGALNQKFSNSGLTNDPGCIDTVNFGFFPEWLYFQCQQAGDIQLLVGPAGLNQAGIVYGPFSSVSTMHTAAINQTLGSAEAPIAFCSQTTFGDLVIDISSMQQGDYYLMCLTQDVSGVLAQPVNQVGGSGTLNGIIVNNNYQHFINGIAFYDQNQNGVYDGIDTPLPSFLTSITSLNAITFSDNQGVFEFVNYTMDSVNYSLSSIAPTHFSASTPTSYQFYLDSTDNVSDSIGFGFYMDSLIYVADGEIGMSSMNSCILAGYLGIEIENQGSLPFDAEIKVTLDDYVDYFSSSIPLASQTGNDLHFDVNNISMLSLESFGINTMPQITLGVGDTTKCFLEINFKDSLGNVFKTVHDTIVNPVECSYDPNFKETITDGFIDEEFIDPGEEILYTIHFQNTGSAPAHNVKLIDTISTFLDINSFQLTGYSHSVGIAIDSNRQVTFDFLGIDLPDSTNNEPESHGWISYRIDQIPGLLPNDVIDNTASIYFDYNSPIVTNTTITTIDCYILPTFTGFNLVGNDLQTDLTDPNLTFEWYLDGTLLAGETDNYVTIGASSGTYSVVVTNEYGCSITEAYSFSAGMMEEDFFYSVYPNPSNSEFYINFDQNKVESIQLFDESGRLVLGASDFQSGQLVIGNEELTNGVYIIQMISTENKLAIQKIVKL